MDKNQKIFLRTINNNKFNILTDSNKYVITLNNIILKPKESKTYAIEIQYHPDQKNIKENTNRINVTQVIEDKEVPVKEVYNFPTSCSPYNSLYDVKNKLPLFTKSNKSKSLYCAGYYIIHFDKGWVKSFCPKLITIERYNFKGPFKTDIEMRQALSIENAK